MTMVGVEWQWPSMDKNTACIKGVAQNSQCPNIKPTLAGL